jgi:two-component system NtrC family sensor kinase
MKSNLQDILEFIKQNESLSTEQKADFEKRLKTVDKELEIALFKLDRTEKVKRTTAILLEETIEELELKRKAIEEANKALQDSLEELKSTQTQLIQSEKMASLGQLTAGIAHEIQNPLNFVNNFSEVSRELIDEILDERQKPKDKRDDELMDDLLTDINQNLEKINHHGKRADAIVKGMLQHSRATSGEKEPTDLNALADEYLRLAYHGLRAKDKSFNAELATNFDPNLPKINVVPQDLGRVLLNLLTNAFYATQKRLESSPLLAAGGQFQPMVELSTSIKNSSVEISVKDNGSGIPAEVVDKIFQPFFTTKPTGEGTGLGLSLAYDIAKAHGGELSVKNRPGGGCTFTMKLPIQRHE